MIWIIIAGFGSIFFIFMWSMLSFPQSRRSRWLAVGGFLLVATCYAGLLLDMQARPKAKTLEWRTGEAEVTAALIKPDDAIYLWVIFLHANEPRSYWVPWSEEAQASLEAAMAQAEKDGERVMIDFGDPEEEDDGDSGVGTQSLVDNKALLFYSAPQPAEPLKVPVQNVPEIEF